MSWETRRNGLRYYYEARKVGGKVVLRRRRNERMGLRGGIARPDRRRRANQQSARTARDLADLDLMAAQVKQFCDAVQAINRATLTGNGYKQHNRGEWRRSRMTTKQGTQERTGPYRPQDTESSN